MMLDLFHTLRLASPYLSLHARAAAAGRVGIRRCPLSDIIRAEVLHRIMLSISAASADRPHHSEHFGRPLVDGPEVLHRIGVLVIPGPLLGRQPLLRPQAGEFFAPLQIPLHLLEARPAPAVLVHHRAHASPVRGLGVRARDVGQGLHKNALEGIAKRKDVTPETGGFVRARRPVQGEDFLPGEQPRRIVPPEIGAIVDGAPSEINEFQVLVDYGPYEIVDLDIPRRSRNSSQFCMLMSFQFPSAKREKLSDCYYTMVKTTFCFSRSTNACARPTCPDVHDRPPKTRDSSPYLCTTPFACTASTANSMRSNRCIRSSLFSNLGSWKTVPRSRNSSGFPPCRYPNICRGFVG